ncbi:hypothetical protein A9R01_00845 ['Osedax' symbiont bacterium Rs2_46_30_T18]|nr:hypothetical protein A9R01_00845 ['Osedax' symbiont bacterium Rs2_46_30_T18]
MLFQNIDILWITFCAGIVFMMQAGFMCLESGLTRNMNSINVAMKNVADISLAFLVFWLFGFGLMFGESYQGVIGVSLFLIEQREISANVLTMFLFQAMFCGAAVTIISGAIAERIKFSSYLVITLVIASVIYPVVGHWVWGGLLGGTSGWLAEKGFIDFAGSSVVHSLGGWSALALLIIIGPRKNRFFADGRPRKVEPSNLPMAMLGVLILWFGWIGFNGGSVLAFNDSVANVIVNTMLAGSAGLSTGLFLERWIYRHYSPKSCINGALAGLVAVTASANIVSGTDALIIGAVGAIVALALDVLLLRFKIDDAVSAVPVHLGAGVWGTFAVALFANDQLNNGLNTLEQLTIQGLGVLVCGLWAFALTYIICSTINYFHPLRISDAVENEGLDLAEHRVGNGVCDLIKVMYANTPKQAHGQAANTGEYSSTSPASSLYTPDLDLTEFTQREIQSNKTRYETIANFSPVGIFNLDAEGKCLFVNDIWEGIFDLSYDECVGQNWLNYSGDNKVMTQWQKWALDIVRQKEVGREEIVFRNDGEQLEIYVQILPEISDTGTLKGYVGTVSDITERVRELLEFERGNKMESADFISAGISHDPGAPLTTGSNNKQPQDTVRDFLSLQKLYTQLINQVLSGRNPNALINEIEKRSSENNIEFFMEQIPTSIEEILQGVNKPAEPA